MAGRSAPTQSGARTSPARHPSAGRIRDEPPKSAWPLSRGWTLVLIGLAVLFALLRGIYALAADSAEPSLMLTERVVVVGVTGRPQLTEADRTILAAHLDSAQVGSMAARGRYVPDCAAAGWTTLGAGRRAAVGGLCDPVVADGVVTDWAARQAAAAARNGDAQLGTLANSVTGCVAAVGPGAGLAAARPDGTIAAYSTPQQFVDGGLDLSCPVTLIDAGELSDQIIARAGHRRFGHPRRHRYRTRPRHAGSRPATDLRSPYRAPGLADVGQHATSRHRHVDRSDPHLDRLQPPGQFTGATRRGRVTVRVLSGRRSASTESKTSWRRPRALGCRTDRLSGRRDPRRRASAVDGRWSDRGPPERSPG